MDYPNVAEILLFLRNLATSTVMDYPIVEIYFMPSEELRHLNSNVLPYHSTALSLKIISTL